ncbi:MAG: hypothetical protein LQ339_003849 [Xanthoria mediterranea]|nr:MAG: hypothetical protein LQ339_003849 [Xanthoria mediterranea]
MSRYGCPRHSHMSHRAPMYYDPVTREYYDDPSDEEDIQGDYAPNDEHARSAHRALYAYARPLGGAPFFPPTVCHSGCRTLAHRIPSGGLPSGASLGVSHRIAVEERICLTHVPGGCFDGGICERLNTVNSVDTCIELGYHGRQFQCQRQVLRVAAGLSPGPPDDDDAANAAGVLELRDESIMDSMRHNASVLAIHKGIQRSLRNRVLQWDDVPDSDYENLPEVSSYRTKSKILTTSIISKEIVQLEDVSDVPMQITPLISVDCLKGIIVIMQYLLLLGQADVTVVRKEGMEEDGCERGNERARVFGTSDGSFDEEKGNGLLNVDLLESRSG